MINLFDKIESILSPHTVPYPKRIELSRFLNELKIREDMDAWEVVPCQQCKTLAKELTEMQQSFNSLNRAFNKLQNEYKDERFSTVHI